MPIFGPYIESVLISTGLNIILALGCYLPLSAGLPSLGQAGFAAVGAYTSAVLTVMGGVPFYLALILGAGAAGITGFLIGFPVLRVRGIYLVIMSWGFAETIRVFFLNIEAVGGAGGLRGIKPETNIFMIYGVIAVLIIFFRRVGRSRLGRAFGAVKEDEVAAQAVGVNLPYVKMLSFSIGALITGVGGGLYAHYAMYIEPQDFSFFLSAEILFFCVVGGEESFWGAILGAAILTILPEIFRIIQDWRLVFYGATLVLMMIFRPHGLLTKDILSWQRWARAVKPRIGGPN